MKAIILAAGYATRLYPLTKDQPKPLLNVNGTPIIEHIINQVKTLKEVNQIYIITNHRFYPHFQSWLNSYPTTKKIKLLNDGTLNNDDRLGSIGDLHFVIKEEGINEDILMIAGDNLFGFNLNSFCNFFQKNQASCLAVCDLKSKEKVANLLGVVILDSNQRIIDFEEKPANPKSTLAATCCYLFSKKDLPLVSEYVKISEKADKPGDFAKWFSQRNKMMGFTFKEHWFDIGSFEGLEEANHFYEKLN